MVNKVGTVWFGGSVTPFPFLLKPSLRHSRKPLPPPDQYTFNVPAAAAGSAEGEMKQSQSYLGAVVLMMCDFAAT